MTELTQSLPRFVNHLDRREVRLIYERVTNLKEYLLRLRSTVHIISYPLQRHHQHYHFGEPEGGAGNVQRRLNQQQTRGNFSSLYHRAGQVVEPPPMRNPLRGGEVIEIARQLARENLRGLAASRSSILTPNPSLQGRETLRGTIPPPPLQQGSFFEMALEMPQFAVVAPEWDEWDEGDDEMNTLDIMEMSLNTPQPSQRGSGLVAAARIRSDVYKNINTKNKDEACVICREDFQTGCIVRQLPCKHIFHDNCVLEWFIKDNTCPTCRAMIDGAGPN